MSHIQRRRPVAWVLAVVSAFTVGGLVSWMLWSFVPGGSSGSGGGAATADDSFTISGDLAEPVSPGAAIPLDLSITNTHTSPLVVSDVTVIVQSIHAPNATESRPCSTDDYEVLQMPVTLTLLVGSRTSSSLAELDVAQEDWPQVGMIDAASNQDGCKSASLELAYTATGKFDR